METTTQSSPASSAATEINPAAMGIDTTPTQFVESESVSEGSGSETSEAPTPPFTSKPAAQPEPAAEPEEDLISQALTRHQAKTNKPGQTTPGRPKRDFTGLDEAERSMFDNMNRAAYEKLYPLYIKLKGKENLIDELDKVPTYKSELENLRKAPKSSSYYDDPDAYMLSTDYRTNLVAKAETENLVNFWEEQLIAIESGKPFKALQQTAEGWQETKPINPSPAAKVKVGNILAQARAQLNNQAAKLEQIKEAHGSTYRSYTEKLGTIHNNIFGKHEALLKPLADKELEAFPDFARSRPEVKSLAYAFALFKHMIKLDKETKQTAAAATATARAARSSGPAMDNAAAAVNGTSNGYSDADYQKFKREFL